MFYISHVDLTSRILTSSLSGIRIAPSMNLIGALTKSSQSLRALKHNVDFKAEESGNLQ